MCVCMHMYNIPGIYGISCLNGAWNVNPPLFGNYSSVQRLTLYGYSVCKHSFTAHHIKGIDRYWLVDLGPSLYIHYSKYVVQPFVHVFILTVLFSMPCQTTPRQAG